MAAILDYHLTGGASNSDPNASLGGVRSSVTVSGTALNNIFDNVTPGEATSGDMEYRAIDVFNSGDASSTSTEGFMGPETTSTDTQLDFGLEASPIDSTLSIADESTPPAAVTFAHHLTGSRLTFPDIPIGSYARLWIRRVVSAAALNDPNDQGTINVEFA